jgi:hypothetical protein
MCGSEGKRTDWGLPKKTDRLAIAKKSRSIATFAAPHG